MIVQSFLNTFKEGEEQKYTFIKMKHFPSQKDITTKIQTRVYVRETVYTHTGGR